nr:hypothetical protein [Mastigocoleus sp. MO_167.B18]
PIVSETPIPTQTVIPEDEEPVVYTKRLVFDIEDKAEVNGKIKANETIQYVFFAKENQNLNALISEHTGVVMTVLTPNGEPIDLGGLQVFLQTRLPSSGRYVIQLNTDEGITESSYELKVELEKLVETIPEQSIQEDTPEIAPTENAPEQPTIEDPLEKPRTENEKIPTEPETEKTPEEPRTDNENIPTEPETENPPPQFPSDNPAQTPSFPINPETDRTDPINHSF